jgi:hypothetical protein
VTRYLTEDVFDPTGFTPNHAELQAVIDGVAEDGGGTVCVPAGWHIAIRRPVVLKPGVRLVSEGHRAGRILTGNYYLDAAGNRQTDAVGVMPAVTTFSEHMFETAGPDRLGPHTSPQGMLLGPQSVGRPVLNLSRSSSQRHPKADGSVEITCTVTRTGATGGWVWTHGGAVLSTETPVICGLRLVGDRFHVVTHYWTGQTVESDEVVNVNDQVTVRVLVAADGTPNLWVNGVEATARNGSPIPLPAHRHYHQTLLGGCAGRWNQWDAQDVADCRVKDFVWHNLYLPYHLPLTDEDGPYVKGGDGFKELHALEFRLPFQGQVGCGVENLTITALGGVGLWVDNAQDFAVRDLTVSGLNGVAFTNNVYAGLASGLRIDAAHVAVQCVNNAAMFALRDVHASAPTVAVSLANCYGANLDDWWVGAVQAGGCAVHVDGPGCTASFRSFRFFDEGASGGTPAHLTNTRSVHFDHGCVLQRSTPGPAAVVDGGGAYHFDGILSSPDRLTRIQVVAPPEAIAGPAAAREWW